MNDNNKNRIFEALKKLDEQRKYGSEKARQKRQAKQRGLNYNPFYRIINGNETLAKKQIIKPKKEHNQRIPFIICNYVEMSQKKLEKVRDFLDDYSK